MIHLEVPLPGRTYPVLVGDGARHELASVIPPGTRRVAVVTQHEVGVDVDPGREFRVFVMGDGEAAKTMTTVETLCRDFAQWGLNRNDVVVAVGGGIVTDTAGFAAASYHRGVPVIHVATTLLGQVDAAIGGKTGVNIPEGKNLIGAYWQPSAVLCDTEVLRSMPPREYRSGFGEVAKYHFLGGDHLDGLSLPEQVAACVRIKAEVVASDEREAGRRAILNYGHTLAHAIETAGSYDVRHGEAVAVGLVFAAEVAHQLGRIDAERVALHRQIVAGYDLPTTLPSGLAAPDLTGLFARDKKALDGVAFVLDGPDGVEVVTNVPADAIHAAFARITP